MKKFSATFLSLTKSVTMAVEANMDISPFAAEFWCLFLNPEDISDSTNDTFVLRNPLTNTQELRDRIVKFSDKYKNVFVQVQQLRSYFNTLKDQELFIVTDIEELPPEGAEHLLTYLLCKTEGEDLQVYLEAKDELFGEVLENYEISIFGDHTKRKIGEPKKEMRICRFCNRKMPEVYFKNIAHSISEGLGNKKVITNDECDECNCRFGNGIEKDLMTFLSLFRTFNGIKGKNGIPKIKGDNFTMINKGEVHLSHIPDGKPLKVRGDITEIPLNFKDRIIPQNIYRTLVKFALSVIDKNHFPQFSKTIEWVNGKISLNDLPEVGILINYQGVSTHPSIAVYIRKSDNLNLPFAVGELKFLFFTYAFIIPLVENDLDYSDPVNFNHFWDTFKHYNRAKGWQFNTFKGDKPQNFTFVLGIDTPNNSKNSQENEL